MTTYQWLVIVQRTNERRYRLRIAAITKSYTYIAEQATPLCTSYGATSKAFTKLLFRQRKQRDEFRATANRRVWPKLFSWAHLHHTLRDSLGCDRSGP